MSSPVWTFVIPLITRLIDELPEIVASTRVHWTQLAVRIEKADAQELARVLRKGGIRSRVRKLSNRSAWGVYVPDRLIDDAQELVHT